MFGITRDGKGLKACCFAPYAAEMTLKVFKGGMVKAEGFPMAKDPLHPGVFSCSFPKQAPGTTYCFADEKGEFTDPYAKQLVGREEFAGGGEETTLCSYVPHRLGRNRLHAVLEPAFAKTVPLSRVKGDYSELIIYKLHVRGFTKDSSSQTRHPGTFKGLTEKLSYLTKLGVNAVMLMPCYDFDEASAGNGKVNFWGYGTPAAFMAPKSSYASEPKKVCSEFAGMVNAFHKAGIEVFMEMDFSREPSAFFCGDVLRFWAEQYGIDGFRLIGCNATEALASDPILYGVRLFGDGWQGQFESLYADTAPVDPGNAAIGYAKRAGTRRLAVYSSSFMENARKLLKGDEGQIGPFAAKFRSAGGSFGIVNYLGDNDGFTLNDVFSYDERHNEVNGEHNRDGREINFSWNCGAEGETSKKSIQSLRLKMQKNAFALLLLSRGTPLFMAGDEFLNTHKGNNNPYCCDNEYGYVIWNDSKRAKELTEFVTRLIALRKEHKVFCGSRDLIGNDYLCFGAPDISYHGVKAWYPDYGYFVRTLGIMLNGQYAEKNQAVKKEKLKKERTEAQKRITEESTKEAVTADDTFYFAINMHWEDHDFDLPSNENFEIVFSTDKGSRISESRTCTVKARSVVLLYKAEDRAVKNEKAGSRE